MDSGRWAAGRGRAGIARLSTAHRLLTARIGLGLGWAGARAALGQWLGGGLAAAGLTLVLIALAYQVQPALRLTIGDETSDKGVVRNFHEDERREGDGYRFRWTRATSTILLPAWGPGPYRLTVEMAAPLTPTPVTTLLVNGQTVAREELSGDFRPYQYELPADLAPSGDLALVFRSTTFTPPADRRALGVVVHAVTLEPLGGWPVTPPSGALGVGLGLAGLTYATLGLAGWAWRAALAGTAGLAAALAGLLAGARLFIVPVLEELVWIGGLALAVTVLLRLGLAGLARWPGWRLPAGERAWLLTLVAAVLLIRLTGTLHPQIDIIDLGFHVNRYSDVVERGMLFLKVRSAEWGGRETTYSPVAYLFIAPLGWLIEDKHRLIRVFTALMETSRLLLVFALARWASGQGRAGLLAATLFVSLPLGVLVFSWGITSNLFGEWWASALLLTLAAGWRRLTRPAVAALAVGVATLALLAHPGLLLLTGAWLAVLVGGLTVGWLLQRARRDAEAAGRGRSLAGLLAVVALATTLAFALFYRVDAAMMLEQGSSTLAQRLSGAAPASDQPRRWRVSGSVDDRTLGLQARYVTELAQVPLAGLIGYAREAWAYYWGWPFLAAGLGWWALGGTPAGRRLRWLSLAWLATAAIFALTGLLLNLYVRYMLFLLPVVCVLAGVGLDWLTRRGRAGVAVTAALVAATMVAGLALWYQRIVIFFH